MSLPDVCSEQTVNQSSALSWVGMEKIALPLYIDDTLVTAKINVYVNLPCTQTKGIHMSRLYRICNAIKHITTERLEHTLNELIDSHISCQTNAAKIEIYFELPVERPALTDLALTGWKTYPVKITAQIIQKIFSLNYQVDVEYSSTCPCSAALARQLISQKFLQQHKQTQVACVDVANWLTEHASSATPHSQRSIATVAVQTQHFDIISLIDHIEHALKTPTQTAVKRTDEQAFAQLNGENLMFVEDATRRLNEVLSKHYAHWQVKVNHLESLHSHNAVAYSANTAF